MSIENLIEKAFFAHGFTKEDENELSRFYKRESGASIRFVVIHRLDELVSPRELNTTINMSSPGPFLGHPAFKKNCDLICLYGLPDQTEFRKFDDEIFAIEEDPHYFKKFVLYYNSIEEQLIQDYSYERILSAISNKKEFLEYKLNPLKTSRYSFAAKMFIKLPFLELPFARGNLVSLRSKANQSVSKAGLEDIYRTVRENDLEDLDSLIKELIKDELENF